MLVAERGAAKNTQEAYGRDLTDYIDYLARAQSEPALASTDSLRDYLSALQTRGMSSATLARRVSALRQFHNSSTSTATAPTIPPPPSKGAPSEERTRRVVDRRGRRTAARLSGRAGRRDASAGRAHARRAHVCAAETLYATGLRVSELVSLPKSAARARDPFIAVKARADANEIVPLTTHAKKPFPPIARCWKPNLRRSRPRLSVSSDGDSGHLTRQAFARDLKTVAVAAGIAASDIHSPCFAPRLRQPFAAKRRRSARRARTARSRRYFQRRRFTLMCSTSGCARWCAICIRFQTKSAS